MSDHDFRDDDRFERVNDTTDQVTEGRVYTFSELRRNGYVGGPLSASLLHDRDLWRRLPRESAPAVLALPEEAPKPAAPSLDAVPVGSRWRWKVAPVPRAEGPFTFRSEEELVRYDSGQYSDLPVNRAEILAHATRIDEPAGTGTIKPIDSLKDVDSREAIKRYNDLTKPRPVEPAKPPARCAPGCEPAKPCRITIPVTDKGTRYECPAFAEENIAALNTFREAIAWPKEKAADQAEARSMRDQRWEPATPMVGRYVYDRRPR